MLHLQHPLCCIASLYICMFFSIDATSHELQNGLSQANSTVHSNYVSLQSQQVGLTTCVMKVQSAWLGSLHCCRPGSSCSSCSRASGRPSASQQNSNAKFNRHQTTGRGRGTAECGRLACCLPGCIYTTAMHAPVARGKMVHTRMPVADLVR